MDIQTQFIDFTAGSDYFPGSTEQGFAEDDGLATAVLISLFTDARADSPLDVGETDKRGWWGDKFSPVPGDRIGSQLWRLAREKDRPESLLKAKSYAETALVWMVDDGLVSEITVNAWRYRADVLAISVDITPSDGAKKRFEFKL